MADESLETTSVQVLPNGVLYDNNFEKYGLQVDESEGSLTPDDYFDFAVSMEGNLVSELRHLGVNGFQHDFLLIGEHVDPYIASDPLCAVTDGCHVDDQRAHIMISHRNDAPFLDISVDGQKGYLIPDVWMSAAAKTEELQTVMEQASKNDIVKAFQKKAIQRTIPNNSVVFLSLPDDKLGGEAYTSLEDELVWNEDTLRAHGCRDVVIDNAYVKRIMQNNPDFVSIFEPEKMVAKILKQVAVEKQQIYEDAGDSMDGLLTDSYLLECVSSIGADVIEEQLNRQGQSAPPIDSDAAKEIMEQKEQSVGDNNLLPKKQKELTDAIKYALKTTEAPFLFEMEATRDITHFVFKQKNNSTSHCIASVKNEDFELPMAELLEKVHSQFEEQYKDYDYRFWNSVFASDEALPRYDVLFRDATVYENALGKLADLIPHVARYECGNDKTAYESLKNDWREQDIDASMRQLDSSLKKLLALGVKPKTLTKTVQNSIQSEKTAQNPSR